MDRRGESKGILRLGNLEPRSDQRTGAREEAEQTEQESRQGSSTCEGGGEREREGRGTSALTSLPLCNSASLRGAEAGA